MNIEEARRLHDRLSGEVTKWRAEFWHCHGDSCGEDWQHILETTERLQREILALQVMIAKRLTEDQSVVFGD